MIDPNESGHGDGGRSNPERCDRGSTSGTRGELGLGSKHGRGRSHASGESEVEVCGGGIGSLDGWKNGAGSSSGSGSGERMNDSRD